MLNHYQQEKMVLEAPGLLEITSYVFFSQACVLGIFFEFADYRRWISREAEYKNMPSPILESLTILVQGFLCGAIFFLTVSHINLEHIFSKDYAEHNFWYRVIYFEIAMSLKRSFYYMPFKMSSAATAACGLHYNGKDKDGNDRWDKIVSVYIMKIETATSTM